MKGFSRSTLLLLSSADYRHLLRYVGRTHREAKAVIFDLDGVVIDSMPIYLSAWRGALEAHGCELKPRDVYEREGEAKTITARELYSKSKKSVPSQKEIDKIVSTVEVLYRKSFVFQLADGISELLGELRARNVRCALVTGSSRKTLGFVRGHDRTLFDLFDVIVTGDDTRASKPNPEPYLHAVHQLGLVAEQCMVVENAPLGIQSAVSAGLTCLAVRGSSPLPRQRLTDCGASVVTETIRDLWRFLIWADTNAPMKDVLKWLKPSIQGR